MTRRVLMLAYWAPPCRRWPTAARRVANLARHLHSFGWSPTILAPNLDTHGLCDCGAKHDEVDLDGIRVVRAALRPAVVVGDRRRLPTSAHRTETAGRPGATVRSLLEIRGSWVSATVRTASRSVAGGPVDAVWTTSGPQESILAGWVASRRLHRPWVADLRDPFSAPVVPPGADDRPLRLLRAVLYRPLLRRADAVTAATDDSAAVDAAWLGRDVDTVLSGIPDSTAGSAEGQRRAEADGSFKITLTGALYPGLTDPDVFLRGLAQFVRHRPDVPIELRYVGPHGDLLRDRAARAGVEAHTRLFPPVESAEIPEMLADSDALLLVEMTGPRAKGRIPGKFYEYLGAGRPIISAPSSSRTIAEILASTGAGIPARSAMEVCAAISRLALLPGAAGGRRVDPSVLGPYTAREQSRHLASILDRVTGR